MEQNPTSTETQGANKRAPLTKPQLWLLGGAILIGVVLELWMELDYYRLYSIFCS